MKTEEIWKTLQYRGVSYDYYEVSNHGRIRQVLSKKNETICIMMVIGLTDKGYCRFQICGREVRKGLTAAVHRIVMETFVGPSDLQVNHIDGCKTNNCLDNLEYCTNRENMIHALDNGLCKIYGGNNSNAKLSFDQVAEIRERLSQGERVVDLARIFNVRQSHISRIKHNRVRVKG